MRDAEGQTSLREIVDRLPLGKRQKQLAEESFDSMTAAEARSTVELYHQVADGLPAALAAARRIRGLSAAPQATASASPEPARESQRTQTAPKPAPPHRGRKTRLRVAEGKQLGQHGKARTEGGAYYSAPMLETQKPRTVSDKQSTVTFHKRRPKSDHKKAKDDAWQLAKILSRSTPKQQEKHLDNYIDDKKVLWSVFRIAGNVKGAMVEALKARPLGVTSAGQVWHRTSRQEVTIAVTVDGETTYSTEAKAVNARQRISASSRLLDNALSLHSSHGQRR